MLYAWDIEVPAGTEITKPVTKKLKVTHGTLMRVGIKFPGGCHGLVKARLFHHGSQLVPFNRDDWVTGNGEEVPGIYDFNLDKEPFTLKFVGCSPLTTYTHKITVRVTVIRKREEAAAELASTLKRFLKRIGVG